jgi:oligoribonuclease NrnB/cAMP/cGMP phosphodiesterase (DHH superfamily)
MKTRIWYHESDLDGKCSAYIAYNAVGREAILEGVQYGRGMPEYEVGDNVILVDFSFPAHDMSRLDKAVHLEWIDHHKTMPELPLIHGIREIGRAGCELTWEWFHPGEEMPRYVYLLGRYDVWDHADLDVVPFQYGCRSYGDCHPADGLAWIYIKNVPATLDRGRAIRDYVISENRMYAEAYHYWGTITDLATNTIYDAILLNRGLCNSLCFSGLKAAVYIAYCSNGSETKVSLFSDTVDVSVLAAQRGGGGHAGAAGFKTKLTLREVL